MISQHKILVKFDFFANILANFVDWHSDLLHSVSVSDCHRVILKCVKVDCHRERCADFVLSAIALSN